MDNIIQLKITLRWSKPPIWRRILVDKTITFEKLHYIIQLAMGWTNSHLYEFDINGQIINGPYEDLNMPFQDAIASINSSKVTLDSFITEIKQKFDYVYDFGDDWVHQILVEKFLPLDTQIQYPICTAGKLNCPPEDCGGIYGFYEILEAIEDPKHPEQADLLEWLGEEYDSTYFDKNDINQKFLTLDDSIEKLKNE